MFNVTSIMSRSWPVRLRRGTVWKFARRNRTQVIAATLAIVLVCCIAILAMMYSRVRSAQAAAALRSGYTSDGAGSIRGRRFAEALELIVPSQVNMSDRKPACSSKHPS
jgi:hypothetical protein